MDEAHNLNNELGSHGNVAFEELFTGFRILATGTPFQNNLHDLYCLLRACGYRRESKQKKWRDYNTEDFYENDGIAEIQRVLVPYLLRIRADEVLANLPAKFDLVLWLKKTTDERFQYRFVSGFTNEVTRTWIEEEKSNEAKYQQDLRRQR